MVEALGHRERGRPPLRVDLEKEAFLRQSQELQAQLQVMEQTVRIRQWLEQPDQKKNEAAEMMVTTLTRLKQQVRGPYQRLCEYLRQAETARRLAAETWLQRNGVITITQSKKVLPISPERSAHN